MDDELELFEEELRQLRPAAPPSALLGRINRALAENPAPPARMVAWPRWLAAAAVPLAAALVLLLWTSRHQPDEAAAATFSAPRTASRPVSAPDVLKPVAAKNVLYATQDEGVVILDHGVRARRSRLTYLDTIEWQNPRTHESLTWSIPREEVRVTPVQYQ